MPQLNSPQGSVIDAGVLIEPKDRIALDAARGWLMLGNSMEAQRELEQVSSAVRESPEVLSLQWDIHVQSRSWHDAIEVADRLLIRIPDGPEGHIKRAYALHELKRTQEAWDALYPVSSRFSDNWLIFYNLACYACQLGKRTEASNCLQEALRLGDSGEIRSLALDDPDLGPMRDFIRTIT